MDELSFVHESISEPDIDRVQSAHHTQSVEIHFLPNLANRTIFIGLPLTHMPFWKGPFPIRIFYHRKVYQAVDALKHEPSRGDLCTMTLTFSLIPPGGDGAPRRIGDRVWHLRLLE